MVNVKAVNLPESCKDMVNAPHFGENKRSHPLDIESGVSRRTQALVVLPQRLTAKNLHTVTNSDYVIDNIAATGAKLLRCSGEAPSVRSAVMCTTAP
jgi:hypothetical protein